MPHLWKTAAVTAAALALPLSAASAATVSYDASTGVVYTAAPGEANAPVFDGNPGRQWTLQSDAVAVTAIAPGCAGAAPPIICGSTTSSSSLTITLGDGDDSGSAFSNIFVSTRIDGGSGEDSIFSAGIDAYADGGSGDDRVKLYGHQSSTGHGDSGNDAIWGLSGSRAKLYGDSGDDLLAVPGPAGYFGEGGPGNDRLVEAKVDFGLARLSGGGGNDILAGQPTPPTSGMFPVGAAGPFDGGSGDDVLSAPYGRNTDDGGSGDDLIDVVDYAYQPNTQRDYRDDVTCGSGTDEVWADPDDEVAADCEVVHRTTTNPALPGVAEALADAQALYTS